MTDRTKEINDFFHSYEQKFNAALSGDVPDVEGIAASFADCFIEASPSGVTCGKNGDAFRKIIPEGYAFYRSIGIHTMTIHAQDVSMIAPDHFLAKIHWESVFTRKVGTSGSIRFDVVYLLQYKEGQAIRIFAYITGDEQKALHANGLI